VSSSNEAAGGAYRALRAAGTTRLVALIYAVLPVAGPDIVSYGFYRLECAIRSAAVLGIIGAGGLGFQLALSFQALRYEEMWTLIYALVVVSGLADLWSSRLRSGDHRGRATWVSLIAAAGLIVASALHLDLDLSALWARDTRELAARLAADAWPPRARLGMAELARLSLDTLWMSILGIAAAIAAAVPFAFIAARGGGVARRLLSVASRGVLLLARAVPPPVWAFVLLLVLFRGRCPAPPRWPPTTSASSAG
jgi:phosphonate transport system permease protein